MTDREVLKQLQALHKRITINSITLGLLIMGVFFFLPSLRKAAQSDSGQSLSSQERTPAHSIPPPHYEEVTNIIRHLEYSGLQSLLRPEVGLVLDFEQQTWYLQNVHRFNPDGTIILDDNRYGLCGELSAYVFQKIQPIFRNQDYKIEFVKAAEAGYFLGPKASHKVLQVTGNPPTKENTFIIDPSFHKYGNIDNFDDYFFFEKSDTPDFLPNQGKDIFFPVNHGTPILIRNGLLLSMGIEESNGKFDQNNFIISLTATKQYKYSDRYVFAIRLADGKPESFENKVLAQELLTPTEYLTLRTRLIGWFKSITGQDIDL